MIQSAKSTTRIVKYNVHVYLAISINIEVIYHYLRLLDIIIWPSLVHLWLSYYASSFFILHNLEAKYKPSSCMYVVVIVIINIIYIPDLSF